jgi:hypothetical protein
VYFSFISSKMPVTTDKHGKIKRGSTPTPTPPSTPVKTNWVDHTKTFATNNQISFGEALSNVDNRCQYYDTMIDRNKYNRGPHLLQPDHPAMHSFIPNLSASDKKIKDEIYVQTKRAMCGKPHTFK